MQSVFSRIWTRVALSISYDVGDKLSTKPNILPQNGGPKISTKQTTLLPQSQKIPKYANKLSLQSDEINRVWNRNFFFSRQNYISLEILSTGAFLKEIDYTGEKINYQCIEGTRNEFEIDLKKEALETWLWEKENKTNKLTTKRGYFKMSNAEKIK